MQGKTYTDVNNPWISVCSTSSLTFSIVIHRSERSSRSALNEYYKISRWMRIPAHTPRSFVTSADENVTACIYDIFYIRYEYLWEYYQRLPAILCRSGGRTLNNVPSIRSKPMHNCARTIAVYRSCMATVPRRYMTDTCICCGRGCARQ